MSQSRAIMSCSLENLGDLVLKLRTCSFPVLCTTTIPMPGHLDLYPALFH